MGWAETGLGRKNNRNNLLLIVAVLSSTPVSLPCGDLCEITIHCYNDAFALIYRQSLDYDS